MPNKLTLAAIFAHPDDEAFGAGGTLAKYAGEGVDVHLITATLGEAGQVASPEITLTQPISALREHELRCACQHYGIELHLLGYVDGQTTIVPQDAAVYKIVRLLRELKPQVVITFGPDGVYGHYDHLAVHRWATAAVQLSGQADCWPEAGPAHAVAKFYHRALPEEQVARMEQMMGHNYVLMESVPFPFVGYPMEKITTIIDARDYAETKLKGILCHASQLAQDNPYRQTGFDLTTDPLFWQETFILVQSQPGIRSAISTNRKEDDLFAGLR
ncbi:MAG: PIG-L family deacetylase [Anaerolineae bacterium]|nr:PIG-L family deacetylase [Anaerolineae bacterium]